MKTKASLLGAYEAIIHRLKDVLQTMCIGQFLELGMHMTVYKLIKLKLQRG